MLKSRNKPTRFGALLFGAIALCLSSLSFAASPVLDRVVEAGVLKVAVSGDQPPFNAVSRDKTVIGFDIDLARALAGMMKVELEIVQKPFGELLGTIESGEADMVLSGMAITPERTRKVSFVGPYMLSGKSMLTTSQAMSSVKSGADLNNSEKKLVALSNSTSESFVKRNLPNATLRTIANYDEGVKMLLAGDVDAMIADLPILKLTVLRNPGAGLGVIEPPLSVEPVGIAMTNADPQFANLVRNYLSTFEKTGLTSNLRKKWFEDSSWIVALP
ncbi:transporter substrate-binding domain-containing protein [Halioglobus maricola]|uniref:Transporter substrate-binding domain-containing protein n=1 Tax=Halioglobus maricola TaxID=2601894 RepID=A0A5P9NK40_9GAMM|nr:transporter substrate-binding domain-containing protein [Halioglobus maricola]QFU76102.1 transporter substrate-binding domain-containing protein [Halioglobus maricola]